ncbi:unnamed protein product, partial [Aphanomyces euteiches]
ELPTEQTWRSRNICFAMVNVSVGIYLGTMFSSVGVWENDQVTIIANDQGFHTTPSFVAFTDSEYLVGDVAKSQLATNPVNTIFDVKRLIGRKFSDPVVQEGIKHWLFKVLPDADDNPQIVVDFKGETKTFTPEDIASIILAEMKAMAEASLGSEVKNAVMAVPAYFDDSQRRAIKSAGALAGLNILRVISEPTAACIAYGLDMKPGDRYVLVFDLGGGTLDVSMIWIEEGIYEVMATGGDLHLGGDAIDDRLVDHFVAEIKDKYGINISEDFYALLRLLTACERAKHTLSIATEASIEINSLVDGIDFRSTITRAHFEDLCSDLFLKMIEMMEKVLGDSKLSKSQVDGVVMVGGSTRIPKVQQLVTEFFDGKELLTTFKPDKVVVTALEFIRSIFSRVCDDQTDVVIRVYEGVRSLTHGNKLLGSFCLDGIPPMPRGVPQIAVTIDFDAKYTLTVSVFENLSGREGKWIIPFDSTRYNVEYVWRVEEEGEKYQADDDAEKQRIEATNALVAYAYNLRKFLNENEDAIDASIKSSLDNKLTLVESWLNHNEAATRDIIESEQLELKSFVRLAVDSANMLGNSQLVLDRIQSEDPSLPLLPPRISAPI